MLGISHVEKNLKHESLPEICLIAKTLADFQVFYNALLK